MIKETNGAAGRLGGGLAFWRGKPVMATNMTHLAPLTWRGFCLATPAPSAGSLRMPVGCPVLTQRRPLVSFSGGRVRTQARRGGKRAGVSRVGRVRRRVAKAIGLASLRLRARSSTRRWRRWPGRPRTRARAPCVRSANQAPSNQPVGGARTRPTTTRVNVITSSSRRRCRVVGRRASPGTPGTA
jgi:hypothetical protein